MQKYVMAAALTLFTLLAGLNPARAQAVDPELRIQQLEEQLRQLNGRVEEMSFQLLQMQESLRKAQEDNEFRFQELEKGKKSGALQPDPAQATTDTANASGETSPGADPLLDQPMDQANGADDIAAPQDGTLDGTGQPPADLGNIQFDANGNVIGADQGTAINPANPNDPVGTLIEGNSDQAAVDSSTLPPVDTGNTIADPAATPSDAYQAAYEHMLSGDYAAAEEQFRTYIASHPGDPKSADAAFWLGEAQFSQSKYNDSAKTFLDAWKKHGDSEKAPEMLLKLAMSLAALDSRDTACATLRQVSKSYPKASRAVINKVASEEKRLSC